jgi:serine/threonine protein kinase/WD40 repeat protein
MKGNLSSDSDERIPSGDGETLLEYRARLKKALEQKAATESGDRSHTKRDTSAPAPRQTGKPSKPTFKKTLGPFQIVEEIGRGGMGVVYRAYHPELDRDVALKVLRAGEDASEAAIERFLREAKAVAKLGHHPGIVPIYDIRKEGRTHFFAMHFVDGKSVDSMIANGEIAPRRGAVIALKVAKALEHAHGHSILHRDIKPANILVTKDGEPQVTDFGLAKDVESSARMTATGMTLGTPHYMPPEQADGLVDEIDVQSDVYSLGATLYEMLTFEPPFDGTTHIEIIRKVLFDDPVPPRRRNPMVDRDLETICLKCLEKDPDARYASAADLASDLDRYLSGRPIKAKPASFLRRTQKFARRHKAVVVTSAVFSLLLIASVVFLIVEISGREAEKRKAEREKSRIAQKADEAKATAKRLEGVAESRLKDIRKKEEELRERSAEKDKQSRLAQSRLVQIEQRLNELRSQRSVTKKYRTLTDEMLEELHRQEKELKILKEKEKSHTQLDAERLVKIEELKTEVQRIRLVNEKLEQEAKQRGAAPPETSYARKISMAERYLKSGVTARARELLSSTEPEKRNWEWGWLRDIAFREKLIFMKGEYPVPQQGFRSTSTNGSAVAIVKWKAYGEDTNEILLYDARSGSLTKTLPVRRYFFSCALTPDGKQLLTTDLDKHVTLWNLGEDQIVWSVKEDNFPSAMCMDPKGRYFASFGIGRMGRIVYGTHPLQLWSLKSGQVVRTYHEDARGCTFSRNGKWMAAGKGKEVVVYNVRSVKARETLIGHTDAVTACAFSYTDRILATASLDGTVRIWRNGRAVRTLKTHRGPVYGVCFTEDGKQLVSCGHDTTVRIWDADSGEELEVIRACSQPVTQCSILKDGKSILCSEERNQTYVIGLEKAPNRIMMKTKREGVLKAVYANGGSRIVSCDTDGNLEIRDAHTWKVLLSRNIGEIGSVSDFAVSPKNDGVAVCYSLKPDWKTQSVNFLKDFDPKKGREIAILRNPIKCKFSPSGKLLLVQYFHGTRIYEVEHWGEVFSDDEEVSSNSQEIQFSCDEKSVYFTWGGVTVKYDLKSKKVLRNYGKIANNFLSLSRDGNLFMSSDRGYGSMSVGEPQWKISVLDTASGRRISTFVGSMKSIFSPDGKRIATSLGNAIVIVDSATGEELLVLKGHEGHVVSLAFHPNGRTILSCTINGTLGLWHAQPWHK